MSSMSDLLISFFRRLCFMTVRPENQTVVLILCMKIYRFSKDLASTTLFSKSPLLYMETMK